MKLIGYARVSTDNQKEEGTIEIQLHALKEYADLNHIELVEVFKDEGVSGGLENRPGLVALFDYLDGNVDVDGVLIFKLDRLARDLMIQENLIRDFEKRGKRIISTKEPDLDSKDATRVFIRQILGSVSQYEKALITMRLSSGRHNKARKGLHAGGRVALGYETVNKDLIAGKSRDTIAAIYAMREAGLSLRAIAAELNAKGYPTVSGRAWLFTSVQYILSNSLYSGTLTYKGTAVSRPDLTLIGAQQVS